MRKKIETSVGSSRRQPAPVAGIRGRRTGIALAILGGMVLGGGMVASVRGDVQSNLDEEVIEALKFGDKNDVLLIIAVDQDGDMQAYCGLYNSISCVPGPYEEIPDEHLKKEIFGTISVGNPKVCWKTSSGDKQCVTY